MMMAGFAQKRLNRFGAGPRIQRWSSSALMALSEAGRKRFNRFLPASELVLCVAGSSEAETGHAQPPQCGAVIVRGRPLRNRRFP